MQKKLISLICLFVLSLMIPTNTTATGELKSIEEIKKARKKAAHRKRRLIYNDDGCSARAFGTPEKFIRIRLQQLTDTQTDSVFYCTGVTTMFTNVTEKYGETYGEFLDEGDTYMANLIKGVRSLIDAGHDTLAMTA